MVRLIQAEVAGLALAQQAGITQHGQVLRDGGPTDIGELGRLSPAGSAQSRALSPVRRQSPPSGATPPSGRPTPSSSPPPARSLRSASPGTAERTKMRILRLDPGKAVEWRRAKATTLAGRPSPNAGETSLIFRHAGFGDEQYAHVNWVWSQIVGLLKPVLAQADHGSCGRQECRQRRLGRSGVYLRCRGGWKHALCRRPSTADGPVHVPEGAARTGLVVRFGARPC